MYVFLAAGLRGGSAGLPDAGWARFGISEDERLDHERFIARASGGLVSGLPSAGAVVDDIRQEMWLALFRLTGGRECWVELGGTGEPPVLPDDPEHRRNLLRKAMYRAGCDCLSRQVYDGPYAGRRRDWTRMVELEGVRT
jgi:hypothetical protein